jgi:predicted transcriptional regulator of viral defense system
MKSAPSVGMSRSPTNRLLELLRLRGGVARRNDLAAYGVTSESLQQALRDGLVVRIGRGVYRMAEAPPFGSISSFAQAVLAVKHGVICLVSALAYHELTTEISMRVDVAVSRRTTARTVEVPIRIVKMPLSRFTHEVQQVRTDTGERFPIFSSARSVCDAFAFSTYVSESIAYEALRTYLTKPGADPAKLLEQARFTKTELIIAPVVRAHLA